MASSTRTETDSFGPIEVPADSYWGAQTERSIEQFPVRPARADAGRDRPRSGLRQAGGGAGECAARRCSSRRLAEAIQQAAGEVARGDLDNQFPLVIWQTGSGTQSNMNANEVIAGRANEMLTGKRGGKEPVHPNDHVNKSQSSNDSFPTAMHVAAARAVDRRLLPALEAHARAAGRPGQALGLDRQDRPHPSAGRDAADARPGIFRLCGADRRQHRADRGGHAAALSAGAGRHRGRHRPQRAQGLRRGVRRGNRQPDPAAVHHRAEQVRRAGRARHAGRAVGRAQHASPSR